MPDLSYRLLVDVRALVRPQQPVRLEVQVNLVIREYGTGNLHYIECWPKKQKELKEELTK